MLSVTYERGGQTSSTVLPKHHSRRSLIWPAHKDAQEGLDGHSKQDWPERKTLCMLSSASSTKCANSTRSHAEPKQESDRYCVRRRVLRLITSAMVGMVSDFP